MSNPVLELCDFSVSIGQQPLFGPITLSVAPGEALGVFGDSGTGKSTLLHAIAGLSAKPFEVSGDLFLEGEAVQELDPSQRSHRGISIVLQDLGLFANMTAAANIAYPLRKRGISKAEVAAKVEGNMRRFGIEDLGDRKPSQLSGGQRQRVALARAMSYEPSILLLDEPLRGLQDELRFELLLMLRNLCWQGTSVVYVSHDRDEVALIADRLLCFRQGEIIIEDRNHQASFEALRRHSPAPSPDRILSEEHLQVGRTGGTMLEIFETRTLPNGIECALVALDGRSTAVIQLEAGSTIVPGQYGLSDAGHENFYGRQMP